VNGAQAHLLLNHLPVVGMLFATVVALYAARDGTVAIRRLALGLIALAGATALPAYLTGEPAERVAKQLATVAEVAIHEHEEAAAAGFLLAELTSLVALGGLIGRETSSRQVTWGLVAATTGAVITTIAMGYAAHLGGRIRHPEIDRAVRPLHDENATEQVSALP
jgi:hypothetical protein